MTLHHEKSSYDSQGRCIGFEIDPHMMIFVLNDGTNGEEKIDICENERKNK